MVPELETPRLILRPLQLADAEQVQRLFECWEIVQFLAAGGITWPFPEDGVFTYYRDVALPAMERDEAWHWSLRLRDEPEQVIGSIALLRNDTNNRGFWLGVPWQGRGLMSEAVVVVTEYWFGVLGLPILRVPKAIANKASRRISERTGMRVVATTEQDYVSGRLATEVWEITAEEWRARRGIQDKPLQSRQL